MALVNQSHRFLAIWLQSFPLQKKGKIQLRLEIRLSIFIHRSFPYTQGMGRVDPTYNTNKNSASRFHNPMNFVVQFLIDFWIQITRIYILPQMWH